MTRHSGRSKKGGGDKTAIVANNCNNLVVAILSIASGRQYCRTN